MLACTEIIKTVEARDDLGWSVDEPGYMAATLEKVFFLVTEQSRDWDKDPFLLWGFKWAMKGRWTTVDVNVHVYSNNAITETEYGWLLIEWECLLGALNRGALD